VSIPYVSRLLIALDSEALIEREKNGRVVSVDWLSLVEARARDYDLFESNDAQGFISPQGTAELLGKFGGRPYKAITGSFAIPQDLRVSSPSQLFIYTDDVKALSDGLRLLPADEGADVFLLRPYDYVAWDRSRRDHDLSVVAFSQLALDCMTGNGRMPAEASALTAWMQANEPTWRLPSIDELPPRATVLP